MSRVRSSSKAALSGTSLKYPDGTTAATVVPRTPVFDVRDYGAALNGSTDDSTAIQAAIDACAAAGGGIVDLAGVANVAASIGARIKINTTLRMKEGVWLRGRGPATTLTGTANPMIALPASGARPDRVTISDMFLQTPAGVGIKLDLTGLTAAFQLGWGRYTVENVTVSDAVSDSFLVINGGVIEARFINCVSMRAGGYGFNIADTDNFFVACTAAAGTNAAKDGFFIAGGNNHFSACKAYGNAGNGFTIAGAGRHMLSSCEAQDNALSGFFILSQWNAIAACLADTNLNSGFEFSGSNNAVRGVSSMTGGGGSGYTTKVGFMFNGGALGNSVQGVSNATVLVGGDPSGNAVLVGAGEAGGTQAVAYAATVTPDPYAGELVRITLTGNITVANPSRAHRGQRLAFEFTQDSTGGRTVTFGAAYATTWTPDTASGKTNVITFVYDGTRWTQISATTGITGQTSYADTFTRADSATTLGSTEGGSATAWTVSPGSVWGISSNQAYMATSGGQKVAVVDTGRSDGTVIASVPTAFFSGMAFRYTDDNNCFLWSGNGLYRRVGGVQTSLKAGLSNIATGDVLSVVLSGPNISLLRNGTVIAIVVDANMQTATKHGLLATDNTARFDNFSFV